MLINIDKSTFKTHFIESNKMSDSPIVKLNSLYDNSDFFVYTFGIVLNDEEQNNSELSAKKIKALYLESDDFFKTFNGSFCGVVLDKKAKTGVVYTNRTGDRKLFYCELAASLI